MGLFYVKSPLILWVFFMYKRSLIIWVFFSVIFIAWLFTSRSPAGDLVADVTTKLSIAGCLTASEFAFTSEQHGRLVYEAAF